MALVLPNHQLLKNNLNLKKQMLGIYDTNRSITVHMLVHDTYRFQTLPIRPFEPSMRLYL